MAPKKTTKSTEKKETTKKTTKKSASKKEEKIQLTFMPVLTAATQFKMLLRNKTEAEVNGQKVLKTTPLIEGLPVEVIVRKGEILDVTPAQFKELQTLGYVESDEDYERRKQWINALPPQHPEKIPWKSIEKETSFWITLKDSEQIYNDKLIRV